MTMHSWTTQPKRNPDHRTLTKVEGGKKKNPNKFMRERDERELAKTIIKQVQDSTQELDQAVEEVIRLGRYSEGGRRPIKVRMRSQVAVEEITTRKGKLADDTEQKDMWIKRDMNLEER
ncbi:hypothetical protein E2C01_051218 [Portunus trituberculatus]|uniref:Uncharacterized protein n=1 Tax=Portunus trituberculatus TaxID=210409 RepID=A0A5B7GAD6_PORTR|nr:hypothetical protein [Portunus trituberculatus]